MSFSGLCEVTGCNNLAEYILWTENYCIYCESHKKSLTDSSHQVALLSLLSLEMVNPFIRSRRELNRKAILTLYGPAKEAAGNQEAKLIPLENWKIQVTNFCYKTYRSRYPSSLTDGIITMVRLNYAKLELEGHNALKPGQFREAVHLKQKLSDEGLVVSSKIHENQFTIIKSLYFIPFNSFIVSAQIISFGNWRLLMKTIQSNIPEKLSILKKEANHIYSRTSSPAYENLICVVESADKYSYITENGISETFINEKKNYKEKDVTHFLSFASAIIEDSYNNSLNLSFIEPGMVSCFKGEFYLADFKNPYAEYDRNYLAPEHFEVIRKDQAGLMFSSTLIALQMLKVKISGLNTRSCLPILYKKIEKLPISEDLKIYLEETLRSQHSGVNMMQVTNNLTNNFTGLNLK